VYSKCGVGKENASKVGEWLRYGSVLGGRIRAARGSGRNMQPGTAAG